MSTSCCVSFALVASELVNYFVFIRFHSQSIASVLKHPFDVLKKIGIILLLSLASDDRSFTKQQLRFAIAFN